MDYKRLFHDNDYLYWTTYLFIQSRFNRNGCKRRNSTTFSIPSYVICIKLKNGELPVVLTLDLLFGRLNAFTYKRLRVRVT